MGHMKDQYQEQFEVPEDMEENWLEYLKSLETDKD